MELLSKNYQLKSVDFKFGDYLSKGFELLKSNFVPIFLAMFFTMIMSIIPLCNVVAVSNFLKFLRKIDNGEKAEPSEIFNFDDFMKYLIPQLLLFAAIIVLYIPYVLIMLFSGMFSGHQTSGFAGGLLAIYMLFLVFVIFYFALRGFYVLALMSLKGIADWKEAWNISKAMTKGNLLMILLFSIVVGFIGEMGVILCGIGLFFTIPYIYCAQYFAYKDGISQIEFDEIVTKNE